MGCVTPQYSINTVEPLLGLSEGLLRRFQMFDLQKAQCKTCQFFLGEFEECRRFPPTPIIWPRESDEDPPRIYWQVTKVDTLHWCGEWKGY